MRQGNANPYCLVPMTWKPPRCRAPSPVSDDVHGTHPTRAGPLQCEKLTSTATLGASHPPAWAGMGATTVTTVVASSSPNPRTADRRRPGAFIGVGLGGVPGHRRR